MTAGRVALVDGDPAHGDAPELDLVLPHDTAGLGAAAHDAVPPASAAWEAAVCWDDHSRHRRAEVRRV